MNRDPVFLRVDATPESGYERFSRCLILAAALQRRRRPVYFLSHLEPNGLAMTIKRGGNEWIGMNHPAGSTQDYQELLQKIDQYNPAAIIVDEEKVSQKYLLNLSGQGSLVVSMDHQGAVHNPSHMVANPLLGPSRDNYEISSRTQLLMGSRYAMVRPDIRRHRATRSQEPPMVLSNPENKNSEQKFRVMVALGEDDPNRQTLELTKNVLSLHKVGKVDIIVRREHPDLKEIHNFAEENKGRVELALEPAEITARLIRSHFAITSASGWSLELACLGMPQLMIVQNENHWPNAQRLEEEGCATCLGWHESVSPGSIRTGIQNLLNDSLERQAMARCGRKLIDGRGPDRLVNAMEIMLATPAKPQYMVA